jgi:hypothetical protein
LLYGTLIQCTDLDHDGSLRECTSDSCGERCLLTMGGMGELRANCAECAEIAAAFLPSTKVQCLLASLLEASCAFLTAEVHIRVVEMSSEEITSHIKESFSLPNSRRLAVQPTGYSSLHSKSATDII